MSDELKCMYCGKPVERNMYREWVHSEDGAGWCDVNGVRYGVYPDIEVAQRTMSPSKIIAGNDGYFTPTTEPVEPDQA